MGKELFLDTKGTCFLCLKESELHPNKDVGMMEVCLRNICRFLKINPCSILLKSLRGSLLEEEENENEETSSQICDFSVMLCHNCSSLTKNISDLIGQMELMRCLTTYQLQVFHQIISGFGEDPPAPSLWEKFQAKMKSECGSPVETRLVEILRQETKEKCFSKVRKLSATSLPKVCLNRPKVQKTGAECLETLSTISRTPRNEDNAIRKSPFSDMPVLSPQMLLQPKDDDYPYRSQMGLNETVSISNNFPSHIGSISNSKEKQMVVDICTSQFKRIKYKNLDQCSICRYKEPSHYGKIRGHIVIAHTELFFTQQKSQGLSESKFQECCRNLLVSETSHARRRSIAVGSKKLTFLCEICNRNYSCRRQFKYHLVLEHYRIIEEKLLQLQALGEPLPIKVRVKPRAHTLLYRGKSHSPRAPKVWSCPKDEGCGRTFNSNQSLWRHKEDNCPKRKIKRIWTCNPTVGGCGRRFSSNSALKVHRKGYCSGRKHMRTWTCNGVGGIVCGQWFSSSYSLKRHQEAKACHHIRRTPQQPDFIVEGPESMNNAETVRLPVVHGNNADPSIDSIASKYGTATRCSFRQRSRKKISWKKVSTVVKGKVSKCNVEDGGCGKYFAHDWSLMRHKRGHCPALGRRETWMCNSSGNGCGQKYSSFEGLRRHRLKCFKRTQSTKNKLAQSRQQETENAMYRMRMEDNNIVTEDENGKTLESSVAPGKCRSGDDDPVHIVSPAHHHQEKIKRASTGIVDELSFPQVIDQYTFEILSSEGLVYKQPILSPVKETGRTKVTHVTEYSKSLNETNGVIRTDSRETKYAGVTFVNNEGAETNDIQFDSILPHC